MQNDVISCRSGKTLFSPPPCQTGIDDSSARARQFLPNISFDRPQQDYNSFVDLYGYLVRSHYLISQISLSLVRRLATYLPDTYRVVTLPDQSIIPKWT